MNSGIRNPSEFIRTGYSKSVNKFKSSNTIQGKFNVTLKPAIPKFQPTATSNSNTNNFKFQNLSKLIVNRMDDVLQQPIISPDEETEEKLVELNQQNQNNYPQNKTKKAFLTDVEIINKLKHDIFSDSFENDMNSVGKLNKREINVDNDFRNLINEVDTYKHNVQSEFDELQYLIKYVKNTNKKVSKHMAGVKNLFKETKIKKNKPVFDEFDHEEENFYENNKNEVYDKEKNLGRVKENIFNIQGKVISFHQDFSKKVGKIGESIGNFKKINLKR